MQEGISTEEMRFTSLYRFSSCSLACGKLFEHHCRKVKMLSACKNRVERNYEWNARNKILKLAVYVQNAYQSIGWLQHEHHQLHVLSNSHNHKVIKFSIRPFQERIKQPIPIFYHKNLKNAKETQLIASKAAGSLSAYCTISSWK